MAKKKIVKVYREGKQTRLPNRVLLVFLGIIVAAFVTLLVMFFKTLYSDPGQLTASVTGYIEHSNQC